MLGDLNYLSWFTIKNVEMCVGVELKLAVADSFPDFFLCFGLLELVAFLTWIVFGVDNVIAVTAASNKAAFVFVPSNVLSFSDVIFMLLHEFPPLKIAVELCQTAALKVLLLCGHFFCPNLLIIRGKVFFISFSGGQVVRRIRKGLIDLFRVLVEAANSVSKTLLDFKLSVTPLQLKLLNDQNLRVLIWCEVQHPENGADQPVNLTAFFYLYF